MYGDFGPLADLADAVAAANGSSFGGTSSAGGLRASMGGTGSSFAKTSPLAYMLVPEFINTPTLNRWVLVREFGSGCYSDDNQVGDISPLQHHHHTALAAAVVTTLYVTAV
jgi:hypothetical protein